MENRDAWLNDAMPWYYGGTPGPFDEVPEEDDLQTQTLTDLPEPDLLALPAAARGAVRHALGAVQAH